MLSIKHTKRSTKAHHVHLHTIMNVSWSIWEMLGVESIEVEK